MSTSPSWFDQDKFARLNKRAGAKASTPRPSTRTTPVTSESLIKAYIPAPTASPNQTGSLPPINLPRTGTLPHLKPVFNFPAPPVTVPLPAETQTEEGTLFQGSMESETVLRGEATLSQTAPMPRVTRGFDPAAEESVEEPSSHEEVFQLREAVETLQKKLKGVIAERDQMVVEEKLLRQQLRQSEEANEDKANMMSQIGDFSQVAQERDEAKLEVVVLRDQLLTVEQATRERDALSSQVEELSHVIEERDVIRRDYALLREQFESLKYNRSPQEPAPSEPPAELMQKIADQEEEIAALRENIENLKLHHIPQEPAPSEPPFELVQRITDQEQEISLLRAQLIEHEEKESAVKEKDDEAALKQEIDTLQAQLKATKDEAALAQRGLALSQKALQETRDALREASEGSSASKGNFENLKNECSTLVQQNMLLQAQHDQLSRELSAAKARFAAKG